MGFIINIVDDLITWMIIGVCIIGTVHIVKTQIELEEKIAEIEEKIGEIEEKVFYDDDSIQNE